MSKLSVLGFLQRAALAVMLAAAAVVLGGAPNAEAKPTGWMSSHEIGASAATEAWRGYGDTGYVAPSSKQRRASLRATSSKGGRRTSRTSARSSKVRYAALKESLSDAAPAAKSITGGGVRWAASSSCLNGTLRSAVANVAAMYGSVTVNSTCRSRGHNRAVGGARKSHHLTGDAVDLRVHGNWRAAAVYLRGLGGGFKHYGGGLFHIDTGPTRSW